jgi:hypothetical protein
MWQLKSHSSLKVKRQVKKKKGVIGFQKPTDDWGKY